MNPHSQIIRMNAQRPRDGLQLHPRRDDLFKIALGVPLAAKNLMI
jgi:hypothetical protein